MENKVYLITGASSDVGISFIRSLEEKCLEKGEKAVVLAHFSSHAETLRSMASEAKALSILPMQADLSQPEAVERLLEQVKANCECPDYIIHLPAPRLQYTRVRQFDWEEAMREIKVQAFSLAEIGKAFLGKMAKRGGGKMVVMLSACTIGMPPRFMSRYTMAKYTLLGLMKSMAVEYADKGININGISPNMMETKFLQDIDEKIVEMNRESSILKRNVKLEEVVPAIHFLLSEGSDYMNGVNLNVTGGDR